MFFRFSDFSDAEEHTLLQGDSFDSCVYARIYIHVYSSVSCMLHVIKEDKAFAAVNGDIRLRRPRVNIRR